MAALTAECHNEKFLGLSEFLWLFRSAGLFFSSTTLVFFVWTKEKENEKVVFLNQLYFRFCNFDKKKNVGLNGPIDPLRNRQTQLILFEFREKYSAFPLRPILLTMYKTESLYHWVHSTLPEPLKLWPWAVEVLFLVLLLWCLDFCC